MEKARLSAFVKTAYGAGNLTFALVFQLISACFYFYATAVLKLPPTSVSLVVSLSVVFDAVTDPITGYISDHTHSKRFGRRHLYLIIGAAGIALSNVALWAISPDDVEGARLTFVALWLFACKLFLTLYATPYSALGSELTDDYDERTSVQTVKTGFFVLGFLYPSVAGMALFFKPTPEYPVGQMNPDAYLYMGILASALAVVCAALCVGATFKRIPLLKQAPAEKGRLSGVFLNMLRALGNRNFLYIAVGYLFINIASAIVGSVGMHVFTYTYSFSGSAIAVIFGTLFGVAVVSQVMWLKLSKKRGKRYAMLLAIALSIVACAGFFTTVFMRKEGTAFYVIVACAVVIGAGIGGCLSLPYSMLSDVIDLDELKSGERREGVYYGCVTFMYKLSQSVVVFFLGHILTAIGFNADAAVQTEYAANALGYVMPIGFLAAFVPALICFAKYSYPREKVREVQRMIQERKNDNH